MGGIFVSTAVILAGGESRRMQKDKMALPYGASSLLAASVSRFGALFDTVYLSVADGSKYPEIEARRLIDIYKGCGPMAGLHAGLAGTDEDGVFLVAADLPFADPGVAMRIIELSKGFDVCVTIDRESRYEPLFAYYRKTTLPLLERALQAGDYKLVSFLDRVSLRVVTAEELGSLWHEKLLLNINYPADYEKLIRENAGQA
jgi:molybdopterin-guanine dinucleotide biosynthesis protein A